MYAGQMTHRHGARSFTHGFILRRMTLTNIQINTIINEELTSDRCLQKYYYIHLILNDYNEGI